MVGTKATRVEPRMVVVSKKGNKGKEIVQPVVMEAQQERALLQIVLTDLILLESR